MTAEKREIVAAR